MEGEGPVHAEVAAQARTDGGVEPDVMREAAGSDRVEEMTGAHTDGAIEPEVVQALAEVVGALTSGATEGEDARGTPLTVALLARPQYTMEHPSEQGASARGPRAPGGVEAGAHGGSSGLFEALGLDRPGIPPILRPMWKWKNTCGRPRRRTTARSWAI